MRIAWSVVGAVSYSSLRDIAPSTTDPVIRLLQIADAQRKDNYEQSIKRQMNVIV